MDYIIKKLSLFSYLCLTFKVQSFLKRFNVNIIFLHLKSSMEFLALLLNHSVYFFKIMQTRIYDGWGSVAMILGNICAAYLVWTAVTFEVHRTEIYFFQTMISRSWCPMCKPSSLDFQWTTRCHKRTPANLSWTERVHWQRIRKLPTCWKCPSCLFTLW